MRAAMFDRYGTNEVVEVRDTAAPVPKPGEVAIKVQAASVNPVDWKIRSGQLRIFTGSKFPKVLGCECSGEVFEAGPGATKFRKGDRVVLYTSVKRLGAFAEFACASENTAYPIAANISFEEAACLPIAGLTALQSLRDHGKISAGMHVLVNGAAGGVGHFAVQIAKVFGAEVTGVCSGRNVDFVKGLGADKVIDYAKEDFTKGNERYGLVFDAVSMSSFSACKKILTPKGIYVNTLPNATIVIQFRTSFLPGRKARSMWVRPGAGDIAWMMEQILGGRIRVVIEPTYPLDRIKDALAASEAGRTRGKIVMQVGS